MPPLQALVALHGLWALALLPVAVWGVWKWLTPRLRLAGQTLSIIGLMALAILSGRELLTSYPSASPEQQKYVAPRILYVLGTSTDLPVVQVLLAGICLWFTACRRNRGIPAAKREARPAADLIKEAATKANRSRMRGGRHGERIQEVAPLSSGRGPSRCGDLGLVRLEPDARGRNVYETRGAASGSGK